MNLSFNFTNLSLFVVLLALVATACDQSSPTMAQANVAGTAQTMTGTQVTTAVTQPFAYLGRSVTLSGETLAVGAPGENSRRGAVYLFQKEGDGWQEQTRLVATDGRAGDEFGGTLAVADDLLVVGAPYWRQAAGAVYIFDRQGSNWVEQAQLLREDGQPFDLFGYDVAISGETVVVGARSVNDPQHGRNAGAVYVYQRVQNEWRQQARLTSPEPGPTAHFGHAVAVDSDTIVVGAFGHNDAQNGRNAGAAYVFQRQGQEWSLQTRLTAADGDAHDAFGVALALDGDIIAISASQHDWGHEQFLGAVYIYQRQGSDWRQQAKLTPVNPDRFGGPVGHTLALAGNTLLVGGYGLSSVYHFERQQDTWVEQPRLVMSNPPFSILFGSEALAVSGTVAVVGDRGASASQSNNMTGAVFLYELSAGPDSTASAPAAPVPPQETAPPAAPEPLPIPATEVSPLFSGQYLMAHTGNVPPEGQFVAVAHLEPPADLRSDQRESSLHFWQVQTGRFCPYPQTLSGHPNLYHLPTWLADGRVLIVPDDGTIRVGEPCAAGDFDTMDHLFAEPIRAVAAQSPDLTRLLLRGDDAYWLYQPQQSVVRPVAGLAAHERNIHNWSPDGSRVSIGASGDRGAGIHLIDAATGQIEQLIAVAAGMGGSYYHTWLNNQTLIFQNETGPTLIDLRQPTPRPAPILSQLFDLDIAFPAETTAFGAYPTGSGEDYAVFVAVREPAAAGIYLYYAADDRVKVLPYDHPTHLFFANGRSIFIDKFDWQYPDGGPNGIDHHQLYWVATPNGQMSQIEVAGHQPRSSSLQPLWLPDSSQMAFASSQGVSLVSLPDGQLLDYWHLAGTEQAVQHVSLLLAPDGQTLIAQANTESAGIGPGDTYLYAIPLTRRDP
jgi:hypothetical protein